MSGTSHPPYPLIMVSRSDWASCTFKSSSANQIKITTSSGQDFTVSDDKRSVLAGQKLSMNFKDRETKFTVSSTSGTLDFELGHGVGGYSNTDNGGTVELFWDDNGTKRSLGSSKTDGACMYRVAMK